MDCSREWCCSCAIVKARIEVAGPQTRLLVRLNYLGGGRCDSKASSFSLRFSRSLRCCISYARDGAA